MDSGWIVTNPAKSRKPPPQTDAPVEPFGDDEIIRIRAAYATYSLDAGAANARRLEAGVEVMLHTGLRIQDAVTLRRDCIEGGNLRLRTEKTGPVVSLSLPKWLIEKLERVRATSPDYFFWTGKSKPKSAGGKWQGSLKKLFALVSIIGGPCSQIPAHFCEAPVHERHSC